MFLHELSANQNARILKVGHSDEFQGLQSRLYQFGFTEGSPVRLIHRAPFGGNPIAVEVRGTLVALRVEEAKLIQVELLP